MEGIIQSDCEAACDHIRSLMTSERTKKLTLIQEDFVKCLEGVNNIIWRTATGKRSKATDQEMILLSKAFQMFFDAFSMVNPMALMQMRFSWFMDIAEKLNLKVIFWVSWSFCG